MFFKKPSNASTIIKHICTYNIRTNGDPNIAKELNKRTEDKQHLSEEMHRSYSIVFLMGDPTTSLRNWTKGKQQLSEHMRRRYCIRCFRCDLAPSTPQETEQKHKRQAALGWRCADVIDWDVLGVILHHQPLKKLNKSTDGKQHSSEEVHRCYCIGCIRGDPTPSTPQETEQKHKWQAALERDVHMLLYGLFLCDPTPSTPPRNLTKAQRQAAF